MFENREEAGKCLAAALLKYRGSNVVIYALPRGGVVLGRRVADALGLPLDVIVVRKIGHPNDPEYAIGAIGAEGVAILNPAAASVDAQWLRKETEREQEEARRRERIYRDGREPASPAGKIVILVDDGVATGLSARLAVQKLKERRVERIIVAVPVSSDEAAAALRAAAAEVITLEPPENFLGSVGAHYAHFPQVSDEEVLRLLRVREKKSPSA